ncbi:MAG: hypothetical protein U1F68_09340 [Gammaproteobacteria bacterium]
MDTTVADHKAELVDKIIELLKSRLGPGTSVAVEEFTRQYYARVPIEDLRGEDTVDLYGAALAHWNFARQRPAGPAGHPRL